MCAESESPPESALYIKFRSDPGVIIMRPHKQCLRVELICRAGENDGCFARPILQPILVPKAKRVTQSGSYTRDQDEGKHPRCHNVLLIFGVFVEVKLTDERRSNC